MKFSIPLIVLMITVRSANAGGGPENVMVVVNGDSWTSRAVANEFIKLRAIPPANVVYLNGLLDIGTTPVKTFRERILKPVLTAIEKRGLRDQIDYVVYSTDLPYAVDVRGDLGKRKLPRVFTPTGSINGLTYLHEQVLAEDVNYLQLNSNRYMRRPVRDRPRKPISNEDVKRFREAVQFINGKQWSEAITIFTKLADTYPAQASLHYNLACCLAQTKKADKAITALRKAVTAGWSKSQHTKNDTDLKSLRTHKEFLGLLADMEKKRLATFNVQPTQAFRSRYRWNERGEKIAKTGRRYLLSTMLAVTGGRGNSVGEALASLRRSAAADNSQPQGTIYYLVNGNIRSKTRESAFRSAVAQLKKLGVKAEINPGVLPKGKKDVAGAMIGTASFSWPSSKNTITPGAICEHLTSFGGVMREAAGQTPLTEFLRHGAAGSSGTVTEPFAIQAKFPFAFLHVYYARGCSLAEAFYQSVAGPYQLLIVGDPLCQPWARQMKITATGLKADATVSGSISITVTVSDSKGDELKKGHLELFLDGRHVKTVGLNQQFKIDTSKLPDGYHEVRIIAVRGDAIETQSRLVLPFFVNNYGHCVELMKSSENKVAWNKSVRFRVSAKGEKSISLMHNSKSLGRIDGETGHIDTTPLDIGPGPVLVFAVAMVDGHSVRSKPISFTVIAPETSKSLNNIGIKNTTAGLLLTIAKGDPTTIKATRDWRWLSKQGLKPEQSFSLNGEFQAERTAVYQLLLRSNCAVEVLIDGRKFVQSKPWTAVTTGWQFVPIPLKKGTHRIQLQGTAVKNPLLEIRFGDRGAQSLDGKRFRHGPIVRR